MSANLSSLLEQTRRLANGPGVYRFYDAANTLLYVGKAKSLRKRVRTYFSTTKQQTPKLRLLANAICRIETTVTPTESDALVLEHEQIKTLRPRHNVMFRDDKSYPYVRLSNHAYPRLSSFRGKPGDDCYGPYPSGWAVRESIRVLQRVFQLRTCTDADFAQRTRPCLLHQIGKCSAPCVNAVSTEDYTAAVTNAHRFMQGDDDAVSADLATKMEAAAARQDYEQAARHRDSLQALADVRHRSAVTGGPPEADFIGLYQGQEGNSVHLSAVRSGRLVSDIDFFPENADGDCAADILTAFVAQHYDRHRAPARVILSCPGDAAALARLAGRPHTTVITRPQGRERERVAMATANAAAAVKSRSTSVSSAQTALKRLGDLLQRPDLARVDCFDISHSMGEEAVAACVVCIAGTMQTKLYRRYRLRATAGGDDYGGMRETMERRYRTAVHDPSVLPDLVVVDGGAGQVSVAAATLAPLGGMDVTILGIAKGAKRTPGRETLLTADGEILDVPPADPAFRLLQRMRDEAHRFALAGHRKRRDKRRRGSVLEEVVGIGPALRRRLINEFGGLQGLRQASTTDLSRIKGLGTELAHRIYRALHS